MSRLRAATRAAHATVETAMPVLDGDLSLACYTRLIAAFYGFYAPLEPRCGTTHHAKHPLLATDLAALGYSPSALAALPTCRALPVVDSSSAAIGVRYVLEGATLGGQVIFRHVKATLQLGQTSGAAFFHGYGDRTGAMWKRFTQLVDASPVLDVDAAVAAAIATFDALTRWLLPLGLRS